MSDLYTVIHSDTRRNPVTSCGRRAIDVQLNGWDHGVDASIQHKDNGDIVIELWTTKGSHDRSKRKHIATITNGTIVYMSPSERITDANTLAMSRL